MIKPHSAGPI